MLYFMSAVTDEVLEGETSVPVLKPDLNKANPKLGVGALAFSKDSRYIYTRNGMFYVPRRITSFIM